MRSADSNNSSDTGADKGGGVGAGGSNSAGGNGGIFDTSIKSWLAAMKKAGRIKPGGKLVFVNHRTGTVVPSTESTPNPQSMMNMGAGTGASMPMAPEPDAIAMMRSRGHVLGHSKHPPTLPTPRS